VFKKLSSILRQIFLTTYAPDGNQIPFIDRGQQQQNESAKVLAAVPDAQECDRYFGRPLTRSGIQPVFLRIENLSDAHLRLKIVGIDPGSSKIWPKPATRSPHSKLPL